MYSKDKMYKIYRKRDGKRFGPYYYKTIRIKNGKTKTIYLGRTKKEALESEKNGRDLKKSKSRWRIPKLKSFLVPVLVAIALFSVLLMPQLITGFAITDGQASYAPLQLVSGALSMVFGPEEFLPADALVTFSLDNQTKKAAFAEIVVNGSASNIESGTGDYNKAGTGLSGSGPGYGVRGWKTVYPNISFKCNVSVLVEPEATRAYNVAEVTVVTKVNESNNETYNETISKTVTVHNATSVSETQSHLVSGTLSHMKPYYYMILNNQTVLDVDVVSVEHEDGTPLA